MPILVTNRVRYEEYLYSSPELLLSPFVKFTLYFAVNDSLFS